MPMKTVRVDKIPFITLGKNYLLLFFYLFISLELTIRMIDEKINNQVKYLKVNNFIKTSITLL